MSMETKKEDRIGMYLTPRLTSFLFDELSDDYLARAGVADLLHGIPVPLKKSALGEGLSTLNMAKNMAFIVGCDPQFQYGENYLGYIRRVFGVKFADGLIGEGLQAAARKEYDHACILFRAAFLVDPEKGEAYYCYGRACKDAYEQGEEEDYIGRFKAEALEAFEVATLKKPDFADAYYFLGYAYLNLGLYVKAQLTWEKFMTLTKDVPGVSDAVRQEVKGLREEITERLDSLTEPVEIEKGYNLILSGRFAEGIEKLTPYGETQSPYADWWPLWYYLGVAKRELGQAQAATEDLQRALRLSPSNVEIMEALSALYRQLGDQEKAEKYEKKITVVKKNHALDLAEKEAASAAMRKAVTAPETPKEKLN